MNGYERFCAALKRRQPDRVPLWELIVNRPVIDALYGPDTSYADFVEKEDLDGLCIFGNYRHVEKPGPNLVIDEFGITWGISEVGVFYPHDGSLRTAEDIADWQAPDPDDDYRFQDLRQAVDRFKGERAIVFLAHEVFEFSHYLLGGMDRLFLNYALEPDLCTELAEKISDYNCRLIANAAEVGADAIVTGDDYATKQGPLMSPEHFAQFNAPYLKRVVDAAHKADIFHIKHTDGYLWPIMDQLLDSGTDAIDPIEPLAGMDIGDVKQRCGHRVCVVGNVDCSILLCRGTEEQVVEAVKETIAKGSAGGGHIMASSNSIHPAINPRLYRTMVEATREFGGYPLDEQMVETYRRKDYMAQFRGSERRAPQ